MPQFRFDEDLIKEARTQTPTATSGTHLAAAGSSLPSSRTLEAVRSYIDLEASIGGYDAADAVMDLVQTTRVQLETLINAPSGSVALTSSDTVGFAKSMWGLALGGQFPKNSAFLVDHYLYASHKYVICEVAKFCEANVLISPTRQLEADWVQSQLSRGNVRAVLCTHVASHRGYVTPLSSIGQLCRESESLHIVDGCQSFGQIPIDVEASSIDIFTATGRKWLRAPRGTGFVFARPDLISLMRPPYQEGRLELAPENPQRLENFEVSWAARVGMHFALNDLHTYTQERVSRQIIAMTDYLQHRLRELKNLDVQEAPDQPKCGITTFLHSSVGSEELKAQAAAIGVRFTVAPPDSAPLDSDVLRAPVRVSPHIYNNTDDIDALIEFIEAL